jgi:hypothetical protein
MKLRIALFAFAGLNLFIASCTNPENQSANVKIDSTYALIAALKIEQLKITNRYFQDPKVTTAIQEFSNAKTIYDKIKIVDDLEHDPSTTTHPKAEKGIDFLTHFEKIDQQSFDLAIQNNDVVAQQVKLINSYFDGLDKTTLGSIDVYEKLSKDQKVKLLTNPSEFIPVPDYVERYLGRQFLRTYYIQRWLAMERLNRYLIRTRYINEFPQGFRQLGDRTQLEDKKQFDLNLAKY